ncbi:OPT/YSL family transporter [Burkholderiaceae bacterium DAT-1]|nr:OPT/YSL family transporter [Burkholderiaceae bacterium DAT-1]
MQHLTDEQIRDWSREQKDRWWLENVYRGDMPQLTWRAALTGFMFGAILSGVALYIDAKAGVIIGAGLTATLLAFSLFRALNQAGITRDLTMLENNCAQSVSLAAGYMVLPLTSSLSAYMIVTDTIIPAWQMIIWTVTTSLLGVLIAFPLKRRFINEEQLPFPEGRACGVVLHSLYQGDAATGDIHSKILVRAGLLSAGIQFLCSDALMKIVQFKLLMLDRWAGLTEVIHLRERLDDYYYLAAAKYEWWIPKILGTDFRQLGLRVSVDLALFGVGGLIGWRITLSLLIGAVVNYVLLAPWMIQIGDIVARTSPSGKVTPISRIEILNQWSLWWGVSLMVVGAIVGLLAKPELFKGMLNIFRKKPAQSARTDVLKDIEVPLWLSWVGVPVLAVVGVWMNHAFFGVSWWLGFLSLPLIVVLALISINAMALTSWMPTTALSKITQFSIGALDRTNPASNLVCGALSAEVTSNASHLLSDIKSGNILGAKPRLQAWSHIIGILAGTLSTVPLFFLLFLPADADGVRHTSTIISDHFPMPKVLQWKGVSDLIANGMSTLPLSAMIAMAFGALIAIVVEVLRIRTNGKFPLNSVSIGLGVVLPPDSVLLMFLGSLFFWWMGRKQSLGTRGHTIWSEGVEPICAGLIAGGALVGIANAGARVIIG